MWHDSPKAHRLYNHCEEKHLGTETVKNICGYAHFYTCSKRYKLLMQFAIYTYCMRYILRMRYVPSAREMVFISHHRLEFLCHQVKNT